MAAIFVWGNLIHINNSEEMGAPTQRAIGGATGKMRHTRKKKTTQSEYTAYSRNGPVHLVELNNISPSNLCQEKVSSALSLIKVEVLCMSRYCGVHMLRVVRHFLPYITAQMPHQSTCDSCGIPDSVRCALVKM